MKSVGTRFLLPLGLLAVAFSIFVLYRTYAMSRHHADELVSQQAALALEFNLAIREYAAEKIRPVMESLLDKDAFIPATMSTSLISRGIFEEVRKKFPDYIIRFSSDNPRNPRNQANSDELRMMEYFRRNPRLNRRSEEILIDGRRYLAHFTPMRVKQSCLHCHGDPKDAPAQLVKLYGATGSFYRTVGDVAGVDTVAVPLETIDAALSSEMRRQTLILATGLAFLFGSILVVFQFVVTRRLGTMASHFHKIAAHAQSPWMTPVKIGGKDEIGVVGAAFNKLVEQLHRTHASLEERVSQRTAELQRVNEQLQIELTERQRAEEVLKQKTEELDHFFNIALDLLCIADTDGNFRRLNPAWENALGYSREELMAQRFIDFIHPDDVERTLAAVATLASQQGVTQFLNRYRSKDGSYRWIEWRSAPAGNMIYAAAHDITDRKQTEDALRASEERYKRLLGSATDYIYSVTVENDKVIATYHSPGCATVTGYSPEEYHANPQLWLGMVHPDDRAAVLEQATQALSGEAPAPLEHRIIPKDGSIRWLRNTIALRKDEQGRVISYNGLVNDITERKLTEKALAASEAKYRSLFEQSLDAVFMSTSEGRLLDMNPVGVAMFGYASKAEMVDMDVRTLYVDASERVRLLQVLERAGLVRDYEIRLKRKDGTSLSGLITCNAVRNESGRISTLSGILRDVTEKRQLEQQLLQSQKMESVGRLAGGVAHDFNNLLTAIIGYADLVLLDLQPDNPIASGVAEIKKAASRAAGLTQQLLAFSRKQVLQPKVLDLNVLIAENAKMLGRMIGEDIELVTLLDPALRKIKADPGQFAQVLMNLAVNARDAMPEGGRLTVETANVTLTEEHAWRYGNVPFGPYVMLAVSDTGRGMDSETLSHIFEPFFTTKEVGKGTGLGLSTVYGIVRQSGGYVSVYSEPGQGSTIKVHMPVAEDPVLEEPAPVREAAEHRGAETILVVEDDEMVRRLACAALRRNGYQVLDVGSGTEALLLCERHAAPIHLMLTDVVMPKMSGRELARQLRSKLPHMKVVYMSGYTDDAIVHHGFLDPGLEFIQKPFSPEALLRHIREVLDSSSAETTSQA